MLNLKVTNLSITLGLIRALISLFFLYLSYFLLANRVSSSEIVWFIISATISFAIIYKNAITRILNITDVVSATIISAFSYAFFSFLGLLIYGAPFNYLISLKEKPELLVSSAVIQLIIHFLGFSMIWYYGKKLK